MRYGAILAALALVATVAACGSEAGGTQPAGTLVVREQLPPRPVYVEGSVAFLRLERDGEALFEGAVTDGVEVRGDEPLLRRSLEPGGYRLVSWQRPCSGNCGALDPPTDRCAADLDIDAGETLEATVVLGQRGGCHIRLGGG